MQITVQVKLLPTKEQVSLLDRTMREYIRAANVAVAEYVAAGSSLRYSSKNIPADLPSALKGQIAQDTKSIFQKYTKAVKANAKKEPKEQRHSDILPPPKRWGLPGQCRYRSKLPQAQRACPAPISYVSYITQLTLVD